ncbi:NUDIX hydrolase [Streptomyces sp. N2-109]|uniref:NUDIX hydrolase n=1 Tax=Streptomyces gossypii TaxID=2883101 RepID=A0ABT2K0P7_9ACTN|nr:NUDIX hydrolase [Streptomyces gossypii]MCT2593004.1 NUDIX hydrolase [Streptomyces gossypii]MCT2593737.1 NUDIX hydrolase [Streptomyces gossypii]
MAHSDIDLANPPRRRIGALGVIRDPDGRVLLVERAYKPGFNLPGGGAHAGETIAAAVNREVREETGLNIEFTHVLAIDHMPAEEDGTSAEGFNFVCEGGTLTAEEAAAVAIPAGAAHELRFCAWATVEQLPAYLEPYQQRHLLAALDAIERGNELPLLMRGMPAGHDPALTP